MENSRLQLAMIRNPLGLEKGSSYARVPVSRGGPYISNSEVWKRQCKVYVVTARKEAQEEPL